MTSKRDCYETKRNIVEARQKYIMFSLICYHWLPSKKQAKCIISDRALLMSVMKATVFT